ncbi:beta-mannosidase [Terfezia claveryi]|nr:beta-mannosidase [Terfezia claveryi]
MTGKLTSTALVANWTFQQVDGDKEPLAVVQMPTNIHLDLMHHGVIPDPFIGKNEIDVQWVGEVDWVYRTTFSSPKLEGGEKAVLTFEGLDTFATVLLDGKEILKTDNMFIPERVDITDLVNQGENHKLEIIFKSAYLKGKKTQEQYPDHKWGCWNGDSSRLGVRKAQYHYGWDWGPTLMTCGPWRPIILETYTTRISDLSFNIDVPDSLTDALIKANVEVELPPATATVVVSVSFDLSFNGTSISTISTLNAADGTASTTFTISEPELWYPHGFGEQPLYHLTATLKSEHGEVIDVVTKRIGLRRARVVQRPLKDQPGSTFFFEINGIPIFCGGSNWIPADNFIPRISEKRYKDWLQLLVDGNQVMARVWGGGIFEEEIFYDTCDELGILVWQDFLFGCGNYPTWPSLLESIEREATENVKRLRHHPSIVIYAGNNEDYQYMESENLEYDPKDLNPSNWLKTSFPARYIYEKVLVDVTTKLVPETYYHFGSPYGGKDTRDPTVGDIHQWNVWHGTQEKYQNFDKLAGRFVSEFGMEAFPDLQTIEGFLPKGKEDADLYAQSSTMDFHNKADGHERRIALYLVENLQYSPSPIAQYIYSTQLMQSECLSSAYRLWRREWKGPGREYTAGALVWQINDCWPVTSWAIVDYHLRPKYAYHTIARELAPVTVAMKRVEIDTPRDKYTRVHIKRDYRLQIWASNFKLHNITRIKLVVKGFDSTNGNEVYNETLASDITLESNRTSELVDISMPGLGIDSPSDDDVRKVVHVAYLQDKDGNQLARRVSWPEPLKYLHLDKDARGLVVRLKDGILAVKAEVPVKGLAFEITDAKVADGVVWEDNLVDLVPGEVVEVKVKGLKDEDVKYLGWRWYGMA